MSSTTLKEKQDPRSFILPTSHTSTTLRKLRDDAAGYHLRFDKEADENVSIITIKPHVLDKLGLFAPELLRFSVQHRSTLLPYSNARWEYPVGYGFVSRPGSGGLSMLFAQVADLSLTSH